MSTFATPTPDRAERIAGCLFGAAIGDALGSAFEFVSASDIERHLGGAFLREYVPAMRGSLLYPRAPGNPTDDTALALSVAHTLATASVFDAAAFAQGFLADADRSDGRFATMFWDGGPGGATLGAFSRLRSGADPQTNARPSDGGNGTVMRGHPVGVIRDRAEALRVAAVQSFVTHGHPAAGASAQAIAALVWDAFAGKPLTPELPQDVDDPDLREAWKATHGAGNFEEARLPSELRDVPMNAWYSLSAAHAIALRFTGDPVKAIGAAAASGADTDTIACITGAIVGAQHGINALPQDWLDGLQARDLVQEAVDALLARFG